MKNNTSKGKNVPEIKKIGKFSEPGNSEEERILRRKPCEILTKLKNKSLEFIIAFYDKYGGRFNEYQTGNVLALIETKRKRKPLPA